MGGSGDITVWINSPGGDCVAAAQIYNMLMDYPHNVTVKIDGIAASAASVIAMAGTKVLVSPVSMMMIHNPMTVAMGDTAEMQKAIEMLGSVKDSIINAYEIKTGLSRAKLSHLMDAETWMDANKAVELGFSYPPYGYANVDGEMMIVPEQAEIVKQIFADTLAGKSTHEIAKRLNEQGVVTKKGGRWTPGTINGIIGNEKYTGDVLFQKTYTDNSFNRHQNRGEVDQYLMQNHHEAIISREEFERANAVLKQRGREKGNGHDTGRYQNRYGFSGRIYCGECGSKYKRRMHYKPSGQYVAWTCANHLTDKNSCSQKYITDDALKLAFVTMMNKLVFGHQMVLRPLLQSLRGLNDQARLLKIEELETAIEKNREQKQVLTNLMASGYLEPALFNKESNELAAEAEALRQEKDGLMRSVNGDMVKIEELQRLLRFVSKGTMLTEFDDETFLSFVEQITVLSRKEVVFELKCGLSLRERLVEP